MGRARLVLATSAAVLHDWAPREDSCVALMVVVFASGSLTKQLASNLLTSLEGRQGQLIRFVTARNPLRSLLLLSLFSRRPLNFSFLTSLEAELAEEHGVSGLLGGGVLTDSLAELWHTQEDDEQEQRIGHRLFNIFSVLGGNIGFEEGQEGEEAVVVGRRSKEGAAMTALLKLVRVVRKVRWRPLLASAVLGTGALSIVGPLVQKKGRVQEGRQVKK